MLQRSAIAIVLSAIAAATHAADSSKSMVRREWDTDASKAAQAAEQRALVEKAVSPSTPRDGKEIQAALKTYSFATALAVAYGRYPKTPDGTILTVVITADGNVKDCSLRSPEDVSAEFVERVCDKLRTVYFGKKNAPESIRFPLGLSRPAAS